MHVRAKRRRELVFTGVMEVPQPPEWSALTAELTHSLAPRLSAVGSATLLSLVKHV